MSKGSRPRPYSVPLAQYNAQMDVIFGEKPKKEQYIPPPFPDTKEENNTLDWGNVKDSNQGG